MVHIPQPTRTAESQATQGTVWQELRGGYAFFGVAEGLVLCQPLLHVSQLHHHRDMALDDALYAYADRQ